MCGVGWGVCLSYVNNYIISEELELFGTAIKADIHTKVGQSFGCTVRLTNNLTLTAPLIHAHILVFVFVCVVPALLFLIRKQPQRYFQLLWLF